MESGEGIERYEQHLVKCPYCGAWNPVKELKVMNLLSGNLFSNCLWNPVKELKGFEDEVDDLQVGLWNPVKELKVHPGCCC